MNFEKTPKEIFPSGNYFIVAPYVSTMYSGAESQAVRLSSALNKMDDRKCKLLSTRYRFSQGALRKILVISELWCRLTLEFFKAFFTSDEKTYLVIWGLEAAIAASFVPTKIGFTSVYFTERQWSNRVEARRIIYRSFLKNWKFFANSSYVLRNFSQRVMKKKVGYFVPNIVELPQGVLRRPKALPKSVNACVISRVSPEKDIEKAVTWCSENRFNTLTVYGSIQDQGYADHLVAKSFELRVGLIFAGNVSKATYLDNSIDYIFLHTSASEGMPNSLLEVVLCGLPILSIVDESFLDDIWFPRFARACSFKAFTQAYEKSVFRLEFARCQEKILELSRMAQALKSYDYVG